MALTIEDIREWKEQLESLNIPTRNIQPRIFVSLEQYNKMQADGEIDFQGNLTIKYFERVGGIKTGVTYL